MCQIVVVPVENGAYSVYVGGKLLGYIEPWDFFKNRFWRIIGYTEIKLFESVADAVDWLEIYWWENFKE